MNTQNTLFKMGQAEVYQVLEDSKVPLSSKEISEVLNEPEDKVLKYLHVMVRYKEVDFIELNKDLAMKFYKCKRRMRLFYV